ncbi:hypothetical protein AB0A70_28710 [Streptomyces morookaense]|uniref:hypothetical protein n=1 Tax=Streptomyces morookaense TaxID=1970 RepID=UPI0033C03F7E
MSKRIIALAVATAALAGIASAPGAAAGAPGGAEITVGGRVTNTVPADAIGVNTPFWNPYLKDARTPGLIRKAGITTLSFNAGGPTDLYHFDHGGWLSPDPNGKDNGGYEDLTPEFGFDRFAATARAADARMLVHVNYGTGPTDTKADPSTPGHPKPGDPREAAAWVRYANKTRHYGVRDWVIGEETYLNGWFTIPGRTFPHEPDAHPDKSPAAYARNVIAYARAMKAVDPGIRIGIELFAYDPAKPDDPINKAMKEWDDTVLTTPGLAGAADFADVHWYHAAFSHKQSDADVLADTAAAGPVLRALRADLDRASGRGHRIGITVGEANSAALNATQQQDNAVGALYLLDNNLSLLENGASAVDWWALYNGPLNTETVNWGDLGLLSSGACFTALDKTGKKGKQCEPPVGTPFAPYYTMQMLTTALKGGGSTLATAVSGGSDTLTAHTLRRADGTLAVVVVNKDPRQTQKVHLNLPRGYRADRTLTWRQGDKDPATQRGRVPTALAPYSAAVVLLAPRG